ncbi:hepatocellular carcinoma-associated antigen 59-domain-containing protein [Mycena metata]|uniref:Hepatocellular carcinoma-associated antigen 59-domain-containing protein n=1 Tax=Mycena metata TaxID=1033252 RepID=A0AAD7HP11_9AGAR|nr:hepatocellular carcinoma-associated antigen 59-domain-containing protein [Mycena metata]KAJ7741015.1 hepatocellular carcinoma-associated antigen 59-domain-containing protein [Mycena metata]
MIKKRTRPQPRVREKSPEEEVAPADEDEDATPLDLNDLIELRKLRKARQGIDAAKLNKGDAKKNKKKRPREEEEAERGGLRKTAPIPEDEEDDEERDARARRVVRNNNFTQQTNALDVDKHMMAYIEENLKVRGKPRDEDDADKGPADPQEALYRIADRWKVDKQKPTPDDGSVTNSLTMLTAIPEVDLGMDTRLKNIEDTEKAKRVVAEGRQEPRKKVNNDEEHLVASRFYRPNLKTKSDADILRDAKLEAMGMPTQDDQPRRNNNEGNAQMATDEAVMERFKKRMRK